MLYNPSSHSQSQFRSPPRKGNWNKIIAVAFVSVVVVVVYNVNQFSKAHPKALRSMSAPLVSMAAPSWRIEIPNEYPGQKFSGKYTPGQTSYVPAGTTFGVETGLWGAGGFFTDGSPNGGWFHEGGALDSPVPRPEGCFQQCRAPNQPGLYHLNFSMPSGPSFLLDVLVLAPSDTIVQGDRTVLKINGKSIGAYLDPAQSSVRRVRENAQQYKIPRFFAPLTPETVNLKLGPDFDLGQLVAFKEYHGTDGKKVFTTTRHTDVLPLKPELIDKLIKLRERLREKGVKVTRFWITSGFRTPEYNHSIGGAAYSRHCYGDAVDLCIDEDGDHHMDDLNGDGKIDRKDGIVIANACRELEAEGAVVPGGIGVYEWEGEDSVRNHVHIDCRGFISRWGQSGSGRYRKNFVWWPKGEFQEDENGE